MGMLLGVLVGHAACRDLRRDASPCDCGGRERAPGSSARALHRSCSGGGCSSEALAATGSSTCCTRALCERAPRRGMLSRASTICTQVILPVADHLARVFGFQQRQPQSQGAAIAGEVYSNTACHVCVGPSAGSCCTACSAAAPMATATRRSRCHQGPACAHVQPTTSTGAGTSACPPPMPTSDRQARRARVRRGASSTTSVWPLYAGPELHELMLFYLIAWRGGQPAASCPRRSASSATARAGRHRPRRAALAPPRRHPRRSGDRPAAPSYSTSDCLLDRRWHLPREENYLKTVVEPMYLILKAEIQGRKNEAIHARVMYDDANEAFWLHANLSAPQACKGRQGGRRVRRAPCDASEPGGARAEATILAAAAERGASGGSSQNLHGARLVWACPHGHSTEWSRCISRLIHARHRARLCRPVGLGMDLASSGHAAAICLFRLLWGARRRAAERYSYKHLPHRPLLNVVLFFMQLPCTMSQPRAVRDAACLACTTGADGDGTTLFDVRLAALYGSHCTITAAPHAVDR